jgi:hypothetical protein
VLPNLYVLGMMLLHEILSDCLEENSGMKSVEEFKEKKIILE